MHHLMPIAALLASLLAGCAGDGPAANGDPRPTEEPAPVPVPAIPREPVRLTVRVLAEYPHDPTSFTQGLLVHDGELYESTGQYGASKLRRLDPVTGEVLAERDLSANLFGEGLARVGDRLIQLTWQEGVVLFWGVSSFEPLGEGSYRGEGWGLTYDGERLVMSDGGPALIFRDPATFEETGRVDVDFEGSPVELLNELEWVDGAVWANVLGSSSIVRIDPGSGAVTAVADLSPLLARLSPEESAGINVLNGIAWWPEHRSFLVTGKYWPRLFEVVFE